MRALVVLSLLLAFDIAAAPVDDFREYVVAQKDRLGIPGVSIALIDSGVVQYITFGVRRSDAPGDLYLADVFDIGSVSKAVTAWAVMKLSEQGAVSLDVPAETYFAGRWGFPDSSFDSRSVTLRRILSHTAGLAPPSYQGVPWDSEPFSLEDSLNGIPIRSSAVRIVAEPGGEYRYSGGGYTVAKLVVESVTGEPYAEFVTREILIPLGMTDATFLSVGQQPLPVSPHDYAGRPITDYRMVEQGAGGLRASARDLATFLLANMTSNPVLSAAAVAEMQRPVMAVDADASATPGFERRGELLSHGGTNRGWVSQIDFRPSSQSGLVILTNSANGRHIIPRIRCRWSELFGIEDLESYCRQRSVSDRFSHSILLAASVVSLILSAWLAWRALLQLRSGAAQFSFSRLHVVRGLIYIVSAGVLWLVLGTDLGVYLASGVRWGLPTIGYFSPFVKYLAIAVTVLLSVMAVTSAISGADDSSAKSTPGF